jgi:hypothetical protein
MARLGKAVRTTHAVEIEMAIAAAILLAWQVARVPLEGTVAVSLDHARSVLDLEGALSIDVEEALIRLGSGPGFERALDWAYGEIHVPVLFGFLAAACVLAPDRYPRLRTIFAVSFVPAVIVIGVYPLAPPHWLVELGLGPAPAQEELAGTLSTALQNSTAAAASQHFGFAVFVAAGTLWLFPRSRVAWAAALYPVLVFVVIVGTGNHYVLDCVVGVLTFAFGAAVAGLVHTGGAPHAASAPSPFSAARIIVGVALVAWGVETFEEVAVGSLGAALIDGAALAIGLLLVLWPRLRRRAPIGRTAPPGGAP